MLCSWLMTVTTWSTLGTVIVEEMGRKRVSYRCDREWCITTPCGEAMRNAASAL